LSASAELLVKVIAKTFGLITFCGHSVFQIQNTMLQWYLKNKIQNTLKMKCMYLKYCTALQCFVKFLKDVIRKFSSRREQNFTIIICLVCAVQLHRNTEDSDDWIEQIKNETDLVSQPFLLPAMIQSYNSLSFFTS